MQVLLLTDSHFGIRRSSPLFQNHILKFHRTALDYARENGIRTIIHLGDFFDTRGSVSMTTLKAVKDMFDEYPEFEWHMIVGNHDTSFKNTLDANSVSLVFREYSDRIHIYDTPSILKLEDKTTVELIPWITKETEEDILNFIKKNSKKSKICMGHFEFINFEYIKGVTAKTGLDPAMISTNYELVLSGHYHGKSSIGNVHYLGTGTDFNWGDYGVKKYFHILDTATNALKEVEYLEKLFHSLSYDEDITTPDSIKEYFKENVYTDKIVRVKIRNSKNSILFNQFIDALYETNPFSVDIQDERNKNEIDSYELNEDALVKSNFDIIKDFVNELDNSDDLIDTMYELYNYCETTEL